MGVLNGLFVLGRSIGLIAHFLDQKRLRTGLYRHPWDDITYLRSSLPPSYLDTGLLTSVVPQLAKGGLGNEGRVEVDA